MSTPQATGEPMGALVQSIANLVNTTDALAEIISRVTNNVSETSQADEAFTVALVYLENVRGQFLNLVASAQEAASLNQATKLQIQQATNQLEQSRKKFKDQLELDSKEIAEHIKKQLMLTTKEMAEDSKKMAENANRAIMDSSGAMADQIYNLEYTVDGLDQCNDEVLTQSKEVKQTLDQTKEALVQAKEVTVLTMEELKLAAEDMKRERLLFKDQHDRLEQRIKEMHQFLEGKDAESKGLKALYTKLSSHAIRSVQNATNFRDAQYKFLVDGFARFEQKIAFITHHIGGSNSPSSGKVSNAVTTNDVSKVDKASKSPRTNMMEYKITELQKTIRDLEYERDVLAGSKKLLELRLAKFEKEALAPSPTAPVQPVVPDTPCPTLKSTKSKRSLTEAGELLAQLTLSGSETTTTTAVASARPSVESLIQPDLWERLISPALLSDEIKRRLRLIKPQVTGGLRLETLFLRVVTIAVHDQAWENFGSFLKEGTISQWYCIDGLVKNGWRGSVILVDHKCDGRKGEEGKGGECLRVMRTQLDYGKVNFRQRNF
ncbi:hypothetical protein NEUTE1DRAFT_123763 [Neurospora tetrasperma FGSC 2508]|uniref:Uncharacterized protein n=1 Tax=Neurospora tetrasperma (strain FGSC 2508 / ATCC MYA-4615 / P0657) TaxID=510951 RepID=F8MTJ0_NEUT8|nr:uncharacterized protein NEUTE1DRAFT_123763 [Neurospora tetrasperma FGSC 2508]EGO55322.1 hypothetical protein NEUTE1DRAFT_123763 [Neurospora tetrasperma FGSC 2508]EGZ69455.1 hypothetical protein NEUTE2DRAFT_116009 [Neurospora tetrasperma FGSC 2509]